MRGHLVTTLRALLLVSLLLAPATRLGAQSCTSTGNARTCIVTLSSSGSFTVPMTGKLTVTSGLTTASDGSLSGRAAETNVFSLTSPAFANYEAADAGNSNKGFVAEATPLIVEVRSNTKWSLWAHSRYTTWSSGVVGGGACGSSVPCPSTDKPSTELWIGTAYNASGSGYFKFPGTAIGSLPPASASIIAANSVGLVTNAGATNSQTVNGYFKTTWVYGFDPPGLYVMPIAFTLQIF